MYSHKHIPVCTSPPTPRITVLLDIYEWYAFM